MAIKMQRRGGQLVQEEIHVPKRKRMMTTFQQDISFYRTDPQVRALSQARNTTFKLGESVESLTILLKARLGELKGTPKVLI